MFFRDPFVATELLLSSGSLDRLICRLLKSLFSFPPLLFVRVSFNLRSSFSFPYLRLSFAVQPPPFSSSVFPRLFQPPPPEAIPSFSPLTYLSSKRFASSITFPPRLRQPFVPRRFFPPRFFHLGTWPSRYEFRSESFDDLIINYERNASSFLPRLLWRLLNRKEFSRIVSFAFRSAKKSLSFLPSLNFSTSATKFHKNRWLPRLKSSNRFRNQTLGKRETRRETTIRGITGFGRSKWFRGWYPRCALESRVTR